MIGLGKTQTLFGIMRLLRENEVAFECKSGDNGDYLIVRRPQPTNTLCKDIKCIHREAKAFGVYACRLDNQRCSVECHKPEYRKEMK